MPNEPLYLNGVSQQFLMDFSTLKERLNNHLDMAEKDHEDLKGLKTDMGDVKRVINSTNRVLRGIYKAIGAILLAVIPTLVASLMGWI